MQQIVSKIKRIYLNEKPSLSGEIKESTEFLLPDKRREKKEYPPKNSNGEKSGWEYKEKHFYLDEGE